jgi:hypothetical protein
VRRILRRRILDFARRISRRILWRIFARRISRRISRRTPFDHTTDFAADFRRIFLRSKNLVNYTLKTIKKSDAKIRRVLHSLIRQAASSGVSAESDALFAQGAGVGVGGASCAPGLGSRPGCGGGFFRGGFFAADSAAEF